MDHQTLCDGQQNQAPFPPKTPELVRNERAVAGPAVITPTSLARRCDHIIGLIDELLTAPASCANTADARNDRRCGRSPRTETGVRGTAAGGDDVAS
ncbi:MAG: hypothetical protein ACRD0W_15655 [Acidimicrobiales bacterium]